LLFLILMLATFGYANDDKPGAKAIVPNKKIVAGDIIKFKIKATGNIVVFPNIEKIEGVKILSHNKRITNFATYAHGKLKKERTTLILTFAPRKDMTIPSYEVEIDGRVYKTKPVKLKVENFNTSKINNNHIFSMKLKSNKKSVVLDEAFLVTVYFSLQKGVIITHEPRYNRPEFKGFFVDNLDQTKSYDEGNYQVTELRYILTPHSEGNFTLGPAHAKIGLQDKSKRVNLTKRFAMKWYKKASNTLDIKVSPLPVESDLIGKFSLDAKVDTQEVEANKPVNLTIKIEGKGNLNNFDFSNYEIDGVTVYNNDAKIDIKVVDGQIYTSYSKKFVFISEKSFIIPERIFSIYDSKEEKLQELKIKALNIEIKNSQATTIDVKTSKHIESKETMLEEYVEVMFENWWMLVLTFILGGVFYYILSYLLKHKRKSYKESEALKILYGHISKDAEVEEMVRKLYAKKNDDKSVEIDKKRLNELVECFR